MSQQDAPVTVSMAVTLRCNDGFLTDIDIDFRDWVVEFDGERVNYQYADFKEDGQQYLPCRRLVHSFVRFKLTRNTSLFGLEGQLRYKSKAAGGNANLRLLFGETRAGIARFWELTKGKKGKAFDPEQIAHSAIQLWVRFDKASQHHQANAAELELVHRATENSLGEVVEQKLPEQILNLETYQQSLRRDYCAAKELEISDAAKSISSKNESELTHENYLRPMKPQSQNDDSAFQAATKQVPGSDAHDSDSKTSASDTSRPQYPAMALTAEGLQFESSTRIIRRLRILVATSSLVIMCLSGYILFWPMTGMKKGVESATVYPDTETLYGQTDFAAELTQIQTSFDLLVNNAGIVKHYWDRAIRTGLERGVRFRIILSDYRPPVSPNGISRFEVFATDADVEDTAISQREVAKTTHESLNRLLGDIAVDAQLAKPKYTGSLEIRWNQNFLFNTLWLRDAGTDSGFGHIGIHFRQGKAQWPNFRFAKSDAPKLFANTQREFDLIWRQAVKYESLPLDVP